ncbi:hypothetical protein G9A89_006721 [Geosiphon pyriformis]|nr:hypothetical protein G9A89_006721 [Geosiphon pyriformis]
MQAILYFLKNTTDSWYQSLINKPQDFNAFKVEFLRYFSNNNSINCLVNTFTTIKQRETETVTTYLGCFHQNLCQIQAIDANYFTAPQIFNQFIRGLCSSILQHVHPLHSGTLQDAVTRTRDFESTESEANHAQAVNLVMNRSSELDSKLEKFISTLTSLCTNNAAINLSTTSISSSNLSTNGPNLLATATGNISTTTANNLLTPNNSDPATKLICQSSMVVYQPISSSSSQTRSCQWNSDAGNPQNLNSQNYLSLLVIPEDASPSNQELIQKQQTLTSNILPITVTNNESLATIFPFEIEKPSSTPLFSGATLNEKPITVMYTNAKVDGQSIKLILNSGSAGTASTRIITANGATKIPISKIDNFLFKINSIMTPIKVLVMEVTQYQALIAMCGHFKTSPKEKLLIELEEEKEKPTWEAYQVSWADADHNKLPPVLLWDDKGKRKEEKELTWRTNQGSWSDNGQSKPATKWSWEEKVKGKEQKGEPKQTTFFTYIPYSTQSQNTYC